MLLASTFLGLKAQTKDRIQFGVNAGLSLFKISNADDAKFKTGFTGGVSATIPVSDAFAIQPEVNYQMQGAKSENLEEINGAAKIKLSYINVPVLAKYRIPNTGLSIYAGPQIGFLTSGKVSAAGLDINFKQALNSIDFAGAYGLEYAFPIAGGNKAVTLNARYSTGFTNVIKKEVTSGESNKNVGFAFTVGYRF